MLEECYNCTYEASYLGTTSEGIMDEALSFTRYHLESLASQEATTPPLLSRHILSRYVGLTNLKLMIDKELVTEYLTNKVLQPYCLLSCFCCCHKLRFA
ncbi:hypothetical protein YC2023_015216 [Brassica napus]